MEKYNEQIVDTWYKYMRHLTGTINTISFVGDAAGKLSKCLKLLQSLYFVFFIAMTIPCVIFTFYFKSKIIFVLTITIIIFYFWSASYLKFSIESPIKLTSNLKLLNILLEHVTNVYASSNNLKTDNSNGVETQLKRNIVNFATTAYEEKAVPTFENGLNTFLKYKQLFLSFPYYFDIFWKAFSSLCCFLSMCLLTQVLFWSKHHWWHYSNIMNFSFGSILFIFSIIFALSSYFIHIFIIKPVWDSSMLHTLNSKTEMIEKEGRDILKTFEKNLDQMKHSKNLM